MDNLKITADSFQTFREMYHDLITIGPDALPLCLDESDNIWKRIEATWLLDYFEKEEEYDKCVFLRDFIASPAYIATKEKAELLNELIKLPYIKKK